MTCEQKTFGLSWFMFGRSKVGWLGHSQNQTFDLSTRSSAKGYFYDNPSTERREIFDRCVWYRLILCWSVALISGWAVVLLDGFWDNAAHFLVSASFNFLLCIIRHFQIKWYLNWNNFLELGWLWKVKFEFIGVGVPRFKFG